MNNHYVLPRQKREHTRAIVYAIITAIVLLYIVFDFAPFILWAMSGQKPADSFHAGIITETIIK